MISDIRLAVTFKGHRKRRRLRILLGAGSTDYLIDLWLTVAEERPSGVLSDWDETDIALAAGWEGEPGEFVEALTEAGFIECGEDGTYRLHDWEDHQPWVVGAPQRSQAARKAGIASGKARAAKASIPSGQSDANRTESNGAFSSVANPLNGSRTECERNRTPSPYPLPKDLKDLREIDPASKIDTDNKLILGAVQKMENGAARKPCADTDAFDDFWKLYPRKIDKGLARSRWQARLREKHLPDEMIAAARNYAIECSRKNTGMQYIKRATTFLGPSKPFLEYVNGIPEARASPETIPRSDLPDLSNDLDELDRKYGNGGKV